MIIFHIAKENQWTNFNKYKTYEDETLKTYGFLHCCTFDQILHVANGNLKNVDERLIVVCINTEYLSSKLKWEKNIKNDMVFPHLYGPINQDAVINTLKFEKDTSGNFFISNKLYNYKNIEKSCGAIVIQKFENTYKTLLIGFPHNNKLNWGFPKGHVENNENEHETAQREVKEETGLDVDIITDFREHTYFSCKEGVTQEVVYFGAMATSDKVTPQAGEVEECLWCDMASAYKLLTFECDKNILSRFIKFMNF